MQPKRMFCSTRVSQGLWRSSRTNARRCHQEVGHRVIPVLPVGWAGMAMLLLIPLLGFSDAWGAEKRHSWERVSYELLPFSQKGGPSVVPPTHRTDGESSFGDGNVRVEMLKGEPCILLSVDKGDSSAPILFSAEVKPYTLYRIRFEFRCVNCRFDAQTLYAGLVGDVSTLAKAGGKVPGLSIHQMHATTDWRTYENYLYTNDEDRLQFRLDLRAQSGRAYVRRLEISPPEIHASEGRRLVRADKREYAEAPRRAEPPPPNSTVVFSRDPDALFRYSCPREEEINAPVHVSGTPGEILVVPVAVRSDQPLDGLRLDTAALQEAFGGEVRVMWQVVRFHPRLAHYAGKGKTFQFVPSFFLDQPNGVEAPPNETTVFWLKIELGTNAKPGEYQASLRVAAEGFETTRMLRLRVWPFDLEDREDRSRMLYPDEYRWRSRSDELVLAELDDFRAHGINSLTFKQSGDFRLDGSRVAAWSYNQHLERAVRLARQKGFSGSFVVSFAGVPYRLAEAMGVKPEHIHPPKQHRFDVPDPMGEWPREVWTGFRDLVGLAAKEWRQKGWGDMLFFGLDEPKASRIGYAEAFEWIYSAARAAGTPTFCTLSDPPSGPFARELTHPCYWSVLFQTPARGKETVRLTRETGRKAWYYSSGCYAGQVGRMGPNRWETGFKFYISDADGTVSWTFQRADANAFDDFDGSHGEYCMAYPDPENEHKSLDTPTWEGLRQGWTDYRYCVTLERALAEAEGDPVKRSRTVRIKKEFQQLLESLLWENGFDTEPGLSNLRLSHCRQQIAEWTSSLNK